MTKTLEFTGSTINAGNYRCFSFYLTAEGASSSITTDINVTSIYFPSTTGTSSSTTQLYLNVWEGDGTNAFTYLGSSINSDYCSSSKSATWNFSNLKLSPSKYYFILFDTSVSTSWSASSGRIPLYAMNSSTIHQTVFNNVPANPPSGSPQSWAPNMTITYEPVSTHTDTNASLNIKIMSSVQLNNEDKDSSIFYVNNDTKQLYLGSKLLVGKSTFIGTNGTEDGISGVVPAPTTSDVNKYLKSDGTWATVSGGGATYTAGDGIIIDNNEISVDGEVTTEVDTITADEITLATVATSGSYNDLSGKPNLSDYQTTANLVTSLSNASTDTQYPSAKCVYDLIGDVETLLSQV